MTTPLRAMIVDDEPLARARLLRLLGQFDDVVVVADCGSGAEALDSMHRQRPDVLFLDVQMPDLDGFDVIDSLPSARRPQVVFVTAHSEHAVRAFEARAADYLLKPISADRLRRAIERVRPAAEQAAMSPANPSSTYPTRIAVPSGPRIHLVSVDDIDHVSAHANYVELHIGARPLVLRETMSRLESRLDPRRFVRIHRSRIVRLDGVVDVEPFGSGQYLLRLKCGVRLATSRSYSTRLRSLLGLGAD